MICTKCKQEKTEDCFSRNTTNAKGFNYWCSDCMRQYYEDNKEKINKQSMDRYFSNHDKWKEYHRQRYLVNREEILLQEKLKYQANPEKKKAWSRQYRQNHLEEVRIKDREYRLTHSEEKRKADRQYRIDHLEEIKAESRVYSHNNRTKINASRRVWQRNRILKDPKFKIARTMSREINHCLRGKKNGHKWEDLVGYSLNDLTKHLERKMINGMNWENWGEWHIDHIIPISAFNFISPTDYDFKRCWALKNLQPLWASENIRKSNKVKVFQPSLLVTK